MRSGTVGDYLKIWPQFILPQHYLSGLVYRLARCRIRIIKNSLIRLFIRFYGVDMSIAVSSSANNYETFNEFFTRSLKPQARPVDTDDRHIICPVDGFISQMGNITNDTLIQAKGRDYNLGQLLAGDESLAGDFLNGQYVTLYLSPRDYHRIHMPCDATLLRTVYIPGQLFAVNAHTARVVPGLFARNERLVNVFATGAGTMALVMVGAIFVGNMETVWAGEINHPYPAAIRSVDYQSAADATVAIDKGKEMGRFNMGSTVILLFQKNNIAWDKTLVSGQRVRMGEKLGSVVSGEW